MKGSALVDSDEDIVVQGSNMTVDGDAALRADRDIKVLDGHDERRTTTTTETTTFLSTESTDRGETLSDASAGSGNAAAQASASTSETAGNDSAVNFYKSTETTETETSRTSVASTLDVGGGLSAEAGEDLTIRGSDVSGGAVALSGKNVEILAGKSTTSRTTESESTSVGIFTDSNTKTSAQANANATGMTANAQAGAGASAEADTTVTLGARHEQSSSQSSSVTHRGSTVTSRNGDVSIDAEQDATFQGSSVNSAGDLDIDATNINNLAAVDQTLESSNSTTQTGGLYLGGNANASANAEAGANPVGANAQARGEVGAEAEAGLRYGREEQTDSSGSVTNQVNTFEAAGDITRDADNKILDQGSQLSAGGDIAQSAKTLEDQAVNDASWSSSNTTSHEARLAAKATAGVDGGASAQYGAGVSQGNGISPSATVGAEASYNYENTTENESSSTAKTTRYQAGGDVTSTSSGDTNLEGTRIEADGDINLSADSLNYAAAENTNSSGSNTETANASVDGDVIGKTVDLSADYEDQNQNADATTAVTGSLDAGGDVNINTTGDATLEGTEVEAGKGIDISASEGDVNLNAAEDTTTTNSDGFKVGAKVSISKKNPAAARKAATTTATPVRPSGAACRSNPATATSTSAPAATPSPRAPPWTPATRT